MPSTLEKVMVRHVGWQRGHPRPLQRSVGKVFILLLLTFYLLAVSCYEKDSSKTHHEKIEILNYDTSSYSEHVFRLCIDGTPGV